MLKNKTFSPNFNFIIRFYLFSADNIKAELIVPHIDFHKLPHKISAEGRQNLAHSISKQNEMAVVTSELSKMAAISKLSEFTKPHPLMALSPGGLIAQMCALNNMIPAALHGLNNNNNNNHSKLITIMITGTAICILSFMCGADRAVLSVLL